MNPVRVVLLLVMSVVSSSVFAQSKGEMPITGATKNAGKHVRSAWTALADFRTDESNAILHELLKEDPDCGMAYASIFTTNAEERERNLRKAMEKNLSTDEKMFVSALLARADNGRAEPYMEPLIKKYPSDYYLHLWAMFWIDDPQRSVEIGENIVKRSPKFAPAYNMLGYSYMKSNDLSKAEASFDKYITLKPGIANPYDSKGDYYTHVGKTAEAIAMYDKAASLGMTVSKEKSERAKSMLRFPKLSDADVTVIKEMIMSSVQGYAKRDMDAILMPYAEQSVEILDNHIANVGLANSRNRLSESYQRGTFLNYEIAFEYVKGNGPVALAFAKGNSTWKAADSGKEYNRDENVMFLMRRQADGKWKILLDHFYTGEGHTQPLSEQDKKEIAGIFERYDNTVKQGEAMDQQTIAKFAELFSPQTVELWSNQRANVGIANVQARLEGYKGIKVERNNIGLIGFEGMGRKAFAWGIGNQDYYAKDSETLTQTEFVWAMILAKEKDDVWRILALHWTGE